MFSRSCYRTAPQRGTRRKARYAEASGWRVTSGPGRPAPPQPLALAALLTFVRHCGFLWEDVLSHRPSAGYEAGGALRRGERVARNAAVPEGLRLRSHSRLRSPSALPHCSRSCAHSRMFVRVAFAAIRSGASNRPVTWRKGGAWAGAEGPRLRARMLPGGPAPVLSGGEKATIVNQERGARVVEAPRVLERSAGSIPRKRRACV